MADMYSSLDESIACETVQVNLPDIDDTQIWENENETREVALYLETKDGKVSGAEYVPFILPYRWTFSTLQNCIENYINRLGYSNRKISQIYFKRSGKSRSVVAVNSDRDIPAMLSEYPMKTQNGRRSKKAVMVLAVDMIARDPLVQTPRRSPRLLARKSLYSSTQSSANGSPSTQTMDVFLFEVSKSNKGEPKLSKTASVIHSVPTEVTLAALKDIVRGHQGSQSVIYVPANGFYWLRKASKQMVELGTEADLIYCKEEYKGVSIRIGCASVDLNTVLTGIK